MAKKIIAVDIDDVLAESARNLVEYSNKSWGTNFTVDDYDEDWAKLWQVDHAEMQKRVVDYFGTGILSNYGHNQDAKKALDALKKDYDLIIITSRNAHTKEDTLVWINDRYPNVFEEDRIHFAGIWDKNVGDHSISLTKGDICNNLNVDYLIDDQVKHCIGASKHGVKSLLFGDYKWNRHDEIPEEVTRVKDWSEVIKYFDEIK